MTKPSTHLFAIGVSVFGAACGGGTTTTTVPDAGQDAALDSSAPDSSTPDSGTPDVAPPDASPDAGPFDPGKVPGLALWLDAAKGVTADGSGNVSKWADQSGNANDAVQNILSLEPVVVTPGINGKAVIRFAPPAATAPNLTIADAATLRLGTGDFFIGIVAKRPTANGSLGCVLSKQVTPNPYAGYAIYLNLSASHAGGQLDANNNVLSTGGPYADGVARQFAFARTSGAATFRVNGVVEGNLPGTSVNSDAVGVPLSIGGVAPNGLHGLAGDVAEIVIVKGTISTSDSAAIESYFKTKYAL